MELNFRILQLKNSGQLRMKFALYAKHLVGTGSSKSFNSLNIGSGILLTLGVGDGQGGLASCDSWGHRVGHG